MRVGDAARGVEDDVVTMEADERSIRAAHATWIEAVNAGELDRLLGLMTEDVVFLTPGQAPIGRNE